MSGEPGGDGRDLAIGQKLDDAAPLQITHDRTVAMVAPECPIVNADHCQWIGPGTSSTSHYTKQRIVADRQHEPRRKSGSRPPAEGETKVMDEPLHASSAARALRCRRPKTLGKDPSPTASLITSEAPRRQLKLDRMSGYGQVSDTPVVAAVNPVRETIAERARCRWRSR